MVRGALLSVMTAEEYPQRCGDGAILSSCRSYRYCLWRQVDAEIERRCAFIMLNPSTADERENDPTIRKCVGGGGMGPSMW
jgi:hypothetical protein